MRYIRIIANAMNWADVIQIAAFIFCLIAMVLSPNAVTGFAFGANLGYLLATFAKYIDQYEFTEDNKMRNYQQSDFDSFTYWLIAILAIALALGIYTS